MLVTQTHWTNVEAREPAGFPKNLGTFSSPHSGSSLKGSQHYTLLSVPHEKSLSPDPYARTKHGIFASIVLVLGSLHQISEVMFSGI